VQVRDEVIKALGGMSYGLYVVSTRSKDGKLNGQIVNTAFQITAEPPTIAVSLNKKNLTHQYLKESGVFAVSIINENAPMAFIGLFGFRCGRDINKFDSVKHVTGSSGIPIVTENALSAIEAKVTGTYDAGTHTLFVGEVTDARIIAEGIPLTYAVYRDKKHGKTPKNATTYKPDITPAIRPEWRQDMKKYVCKVCGYVYDPATGDPDNNVAAGTPFEKIPDSWVCPTCGAGKEEFEPA